MSRLNVLCWMASGLVHAVVLAVLGTLLAQRPADQPRFAVLRGSAAAPVTVSAALSFVAAEERPASAELPVRVEHPEEPEDALAGQSSPDAGRQTEPEPTAGEPAVPLFREEPRVLNDLAALETTVLSSLSSRSRPGRVRSLRPVPRRHRPHLPVSPAVAFHQRAGSRPAMRATERSMKRSEDSLVEPELNAVDARPVPRRTGQAVPLPETMLRVEPWPSAVAQAAGSAQTQPAQPIRNPSPVYPATAVRNRLEGTVVLRITVAASGSVLAVAVVQSSGVRQLDQSALEAVRQWRFSPALRNGRPVEWSARLPVRFRLN